MINISPFTRAALVAAALVTAGAVVNARAPSHERPIVSAPADAREYIVHWPTGSAAALADMDGVTVLSTPGSDELAKLGAFVVAVDSPDAIGDIMRAGAEYVEPNATFTGQAIEGEPVGAAALDPLLAQQWQHGVVGTATAWRRSLGAGVKVAVVDSGVGPHPDIAVVGGADFTGGNEFSDHSGHGTHVAGICCARGYNGIGGTGVAPAANVLSARVLDSSGSGSLDAIAAGIVWAADNGARVVNLSLGGPTGTRSLQEALQYALAHGALPVCAAGNDSSTRPSYPAAFDECLSVAASGTTDAPAPFTNRHASIDIAAPGVDILSACRGSTYCRMSGTSMAAPVVSGVAALIAALSPITPAALSWRLRSTAASRPALPSGKRVDAAAALAPPAVTATLAPRPTAPATAYPLPTAAPTQGARIVPIVIPPGCRIVLICDPGAAP